MCHQFASVQNGRRHLKSLNRVGINKLITKVMEDKNLTFESVNKHFESPASKKTLAETETQLKSSALSAAAAPNPAAILAQVCRIYKVVRPFLRLILNVPLIPSSWKNAIRTFCNLMDTLCP